MRRSWVLVSVALALGACMTKQPVLYPNEYLLEVGADQGKRDVEYCDRIADEFSPSEAQLAAEDAAADTAGRGVAGAAAGAAGGAIRGNAGTGAAVGAVSAVTYGFVRGLFRKRDPHPVRKRVIERCLVRQGYEVAGWR